MQVICINDSNKPTRIPAEKWVKKGETYTVEFAVTLSLQVGKVGYKLKEIELDHSCFPYEYFDADRFAVPAKLTAKTAETANLEEV
jgi:hypothetical protein